MVFFASYLQHQTGHVASEGHEGSQKPEHRIISEALALMDRDFLTAVQCWFGGGTSDRVEKHSNLAGC
ncbi:hypothetical protein FJ872_22515 [Mesorhizobium sp. B2-5-9]|nr:hypothetical protein FJ872_22515 [Mesorhizobium sp. B2-5-9]TPK81766.1 hypothetical protein FJ936_25090 [Mesorhizobium sp. B2-4-13]